MEISAAIILKDINNISEGIDQTIKTRYYNKNNQISKLEEYDKDLDNILKFIKQEVTNSKSQMWVKEFNKLK